MSPCPFVTASSLRCLALPFASRQGLLSPVSRQLSDLWDERRTAPLSYGKRGEIHPLRAGGIFVQTSEAVGVHNQGVTPEGFMAEDEQAEPQILKDRRGAVGSERSRSGNNDDHEETA